MFGKTHIFLDMSSFHFLAHCTIIVLNLRYHYIFSIQTYDVWKYISRGFYEKHKYLFTLLLTLKIDLQREYVSYDEFQTLIKGERLFHYDV